VTITEEGTIITEKYIKEKGPIITTDYAKDYNKNYIYGFTKACCENILLDTRTGKIGKLSIIRCPGLYDENADELNETSFGTIIEMFLKYYLYYLLKENEKMNTTNTELEKNFDEKILKMDNNQLRYPIDVSELSNFIMDNIINKSNEHPIFGKIIYNIWGLKEYTKYTFLKKIYKYFHIMMGKIKQVDKFKFLNDKEDKRQDVHTGPILGLPQTEA
jgi:nucleoside-diphosphate-sugar epimerase